MYTPYWPASPWFSLLAVATLWVVRMPSNFPDLTTATLFDYVLFPFGVFAVCQLPLGWAYIKAPTPSAKHPPLNLPTPPSKHPLSSYIKDIWGIGWLSWKHVRITAWASLLPYQNCLTMLHICLVICSLVPLYCHSTCHWWPGGFGRMVAPYHS